MKEKIRKVIREEIKKLKANINEEFTSAEQFFNKMSDEEKKEVTSKWQVDGADETIIKSYKEVLNWLRTYVRRTKDLSSNESQKVLDQTIMDYVKEKQQNESLKEAAIKLGYLSEYVVGGRGPSRHFKTDEDQEKLFNLVRQYVSDPDEAEKITMQFLDDEKARMPNIDDPGFRKPFMDLVNYEIIGIPQHIEGDLDNSTIKYKGKIYKNISFEQEDREPRDYAGHITMPIYSYASNKTEDGVQFNVNVTQDPGGSVEEVEWDELEAFTPYKR